MADIKHSQIEISIDKEIAEEIKKLLIYKSVADEAMSYMLETTTDEWGRNLLLAALNIGAHGIKYDIAVTCPAVTDGIHTWTVNGHDEVRTCRNCGRRAQHSVQADECPACAGTGRSALSDPAHDCLHCNGTGIRR